VACIGDIGVRVVIIVSLPRGTDHRWRDGSSRRRTGHRWQDGSSRRTTADTDYADFTGVRCARARRLAPQLGRHRPQHTEFKVTPSGWPQVFPLDCFSDVDSRREPASLPVWQWRRASRRSRRRTFHHRGHRGHGDPIEEQATVDWFLRVLCGSCCSPHNSGHTAVACDRHLSRAPRATQVRQGGGAPRFRGSSGFSRYSVAVLPMT
jgi:hypothetical protein